jgi:hypothetical protein
MECVKINKLKGYEDVKEKYVLCENGNILNIETQRILKPSGKRYFSTNTITTEGHRKNLYFHRLLALAFVPNPNNHPFVNHIDENIHNNNISNLEWVSPKENVNHGTALQRRAFNQRNQKSTSKKVMKIIIKTGEQIIFPSLKEADRQGHDIRCIQRCIKGERKTHKGGIWTLI